MKRLEELLKSAAHAAETSNETFTRLHNLLTGEILPSYGVAMAALGRSQTFFSLPQPPFNYSTAEDVEDGMAPYPIMVDAVYSTIGTAHYDLITGRYYPADDYYQHSFQDAEFRNDALCSLTLALIDTLDEAIREASANEKNAKEIIAIFE